MSKKEVKYGGVALTTSANKLKRYCHVKGCQNISRCPEKCMDCHMDDKEPRLDIDTAVAWSVAGTIEDFFQNIDNLNDELESFWYKYDYFKRSEDLDEYKDELDDLQSHISDVYEAVEIVRLSHSEISTCSSIISYHHEKYKKISHAISRANDIIYTALTRSFEAFSYCKRTLIDCELKVVRMKKKKELDEIRRHSV